MTWPTWWDSNSPSITEPDSAGRWALLCSTIPLQNQTDPQAGLPPTHPALQVESLFASHIPASFPEQRAQLSVVRRLKGAQKDRGRGGAEAHTTQPGLQGEELGRVVKACSDKLSPFSGSRSPSKLPSKKPLRDQEMGLYQGRGQELSKQFKHRALASSYPARFPAKSWPLRRRGRNVPERKCSCALLSRISEGRWMFDH